MLKRIVCVACGLLNDVPAWRRVRLCDRCLSAELEGRLKP